MHQTDRQTNREKMKSMTSEERKTAMEAHRAEMKQWIADNDIPAEFARLLGRGGHGGMGGYGRMMGAPYSDTNTN